MMSTHTEIPNVSDPSEKTVGDPQLSTAENDNDSVDQISFSDPYDEEESVAGETADNQNPKDAEVDDDYAMTFDSDGEDTSSKNDASSANTDQKTQPEPASVSIITETLPSAASESSSINLPDGQDNPPHPLPTTFTTSPTTSTAGHTPVADYSNVASAKIETEQSRIQPYSIDDVANGGIDIQQLLDNITATAEANAAPSSANGSSSGFLPNSVGLPAHSSLPPRPLVTQKPSIHMAYPQYHAGPPGYPPPGLSSNRPPGVPAPYVAVGAPGTSTDSRNALPPPPPASFQPPLPHPQQGPMNSSSFQQALRVGPHDRPAAAIESAEADDEGEITWSPAVQKIYDKFLADERMYVNEGLWDRFPVGSRLFIGNLPTEKVTKRDLFYAFHSYGRLAQVSIKQAYGFVQFHDVAACHTALQREQGQEIRGRKMHLEISKPQKNTRGAGGGAAAVVSRRSRSPDYARGVDRGIRGNHAAGRGGGYDRYDARSGTTSREGDLRGTSRGRDDYRPMRSPSPQRAGFRDRDDYGPSRSRDYYEGREVRRTRSRSPHYGRRDNGRYRQRSPSPRAREADEDDALQIPRRDPRDVPDAQIIVMDELDRAFVAWVEGEIRGRGVKTDVMRVNPRLPIDAIIRRQIIEGVLAVTQLTRRSQDMSKIPLQVFDRKGGAENVRFDEYLDLEPKIAGELILRAKQTQVSAVPYQQPQFIAGQSYQQPPPVATAPNLANLVGQLDNATLQQLLGTLNAVPPQQNAPAATPIDLAGILGGLTQPQQQSNGYQAHQNPNVYSVGSNSDNLASLLGNAAPAQVAPSQQSAQQVQNIMAQLAKFRQ